MPPLPSPPVEILDPSWLRRRIAEEVPELSDECTTDFSKVTALRRWVHRQLVVGDEDTVLYRWNINPWERLPSEILWWSQNRHAGVFCDGFAYVAQRVFELCGFRAATYACGDKFSEATHVLTLVEIEHRSDKMVVVQDAYFNVTIRDGLGEPAEIVALLKRLRQPKQHRFELDASGERNGLLYGATKDVSGIMAHYGLDHGSINRVGEFQAVAADWDFQHFIAGEPRYRNFLQQHHDSVDPMYLLLHPIALSDNHLGHELAAFIPCSDRTPA
jgi:hypothetical protein